jgi:hypothetical protein
MPPCAISRRPRSRCVTYLTALPDDDWVIARTRLCGICGADAKQVFLDGDPDTAAVQRCGGAVHRARIDALTDDAGLAHALGLTALPRHLECRSS